MREYIYPTTTGAKVNVIVTYVSKDDMEKIISLSFKEGFTLAHNNLDELLLKVK
ncbi:hypothetical protein [Ferruginibacter sp.]|nr:hypothetical protein [Ferruginibacter sp.]